MFNYFSKSSLRNIIILLVTCFLLCLSFSCTADTVPETLYATPTIKGTLSIPSEIDLEPENVWVKVVADGVTKKIVKANSDASFVVDGLEPDKKYEIFFTTEEPDLQNFTRALRGVPTKTNGFGGWIGDIIATPDHGSDIGNIKMKPLGTIKGKVLYSDKKEHFDIDVYIPGTSYIAKTAADGSFSIFNVPQGSHELRFTYPGYLAVMKSGITLIGHDYITHPEYELSDVVTLIRNAGSLKGHVILDGEISYSGISIKLMGENSNGNEDVVTDDKGDFLISDVKPGMYSVLISKVGYKDRKIDNIQIKANEKYLLEDDIILEKRGSDVTGIVTLEGKDTFEGTSILLRSADNKRSYSAATDRDGVFVINDVKPGSYKLQASNNGYILSDSVEFFLESNALKDIGTISLKNAYCTINGVVTLNGFDDYSGILINLSHDKLPAKDISTNRSGEYVITGITPGTYTLTISKAGYLSYVERIVINENEVAAWSGELQKASGIVTGTAKLSGQADSSNIIVTAKNLNSGKTCPSVYTDEYGNYTIYDILESGTYLITFKKDGYISNKKISVDVSFSSVSEAPTVELLSVFASAEGNVKLEESSSNAGISILLREQDVVEPASFDTVSDQNGDYVIKNIKPGIYTLYLSKSGYETKVETDIVIEPSAKLTMETYTLPIGIRSITGRVKLELKDNHAGALITATNIIDNKKVYSAISNSEGYFSLAGMIAGQYNIVISYDSYNSITLPTVNVNDSSSFEVGVIDIPISRGVITGVVTLEGRTKHDGIIIELLKGNQVYSQTETNEYGVYSFLVPEGNYSGIKVYTDDYETRIDSRQIALFANNDIALGNIMLKATHAKVIGNVDVLSTEDESLVSITFDDHKELGSIVTNSDGNFCFEHIPLGSYRMRFDRKDAADIVVPVDVIPSENINIGRIIITPNTASITGKVILDNGNDFSDVTVSVDIGTGVISATTDVSGRYEVGGIPISDVYNIKYSKAGWNESSQKLESKLSVMETRELPEIKLQDNIAPELKSVSINDGANTTNDSNLSILLNCLEQGSGIDKVVVSTSADFSEFIRFISYAPEVFYKLPANNNDYTVYIKLIDKCGNESSVLSCNIKLTDQKTVIKGVLDPARLHWTKENSPYVIIDDVLISKGSALNVDPGVDIEVENNSLFQIEGVAHFNGSELEPIKVHSTGGILEIKNLGTLQFNKDSSSFDFVNGTILDHVNWNCPISSISGALYISNSVMNCSVYSISNSVIKNSKFTGNINQVSSSYLLDSKFEIDNMNIEFGYVKNSSFKPVSTNLTSKATVFVTSANVDNSKFNRIQFICHNYSGNNKRGINNCDFEQCDINNTDGFILNSNLKKCSLLSSGKVNFCNIELSTDQITAVKERKLFDFSYNYWGIENTQVLNSYGDNTDIPFIYDSYDKFNYGKINYSFWAKQPIATAGVKTEETLHCYTDNDEPLCKVGAGVSFSVICDDKYNYIHEYRTAYDVEGIENAEWLQMSNGCYLDYSSETLSHVDADGYLHFIVQVKDYNGHMSSYIPVRVGYSAPVITSTPILEGDVITSYSPIKLECGYNVLGELNENSAYVQKEGGSESTSPMTEFDPSRYKNGNYILRYVLRDSAYNVTEKIIHFTLDRPCPRIDKITFGTDQFTGDSYVVTENSPLLIKLNISQAECLSSINVMLGDHVIKRIDVENRGFYYYEKSIQVDSGYMKHGTYELKIQTYDTAGNISVSKPVNVTIKTINPSPVVRGLDNIPEGYIHKSYDDLVTNIEITDEFALSYYVVTIEDEWVDMGHFDFPGMQEQTKSVKREITIPFSKVGVGKQEIKICAYDVAGNETVFIRNIEVQRQHESINWSYAPTVPMYMIDISSTPSNLKDIMLMVDGIPYAPLGTMNRENLVVMNRFTFDIRTIPAGEHDLFIRCVDIADDIIDSNPIKIVGMGTSDSIPYGENVTWNSDGSLKVNKDSLFLLSFEDKNNGLLESVSNTILKPTDENMDYCDCSVYKYGLGSGAATSLSVHGVEYDTKDIPGGQWTAEFWYEHSGDGQVNHDADFGFMNLGSIRLEETWADMYVYAYLSNGSEIRYQTGDLHPDNKWYHVALVYDGSIVRLYVNGFNLAYANVSAQYTFDGFYGYAGSTVDEISVSARAKSSKEIFDYVKFAYPLIK